MGVPVVDNATVAEGGALLTSYYVNAPVVSGVVSALMHALQECENADWSIINGMQLANLPMAGGPWNVEDQLGALVGAPGRNGLSDAAYLAIIKVQVRVNISHGLSEDINAIVALLLTGGVYRDTGTASWEEDITAAGASATTSIINALVMFLGEAKSAGTSGNLRYPTDGNTLIRWDDSVSHNVGAHGFKDSVGGSFPDELAGLQWVH